MMVDDMMVNQLQDLIIVKQLWPYSFLRSLQDNPKFLQFRRALPPNSARQRERENLEFSLLPKFQPRFFYAINQIQSLHYSPPQQKCGLPEGVHICDVLITGKSTSKGKI